MRYRLALLVLGDMFSALIALYTALLLRFGYDADCTTFLLDNVQIPVLVVVVSIFSTYLAECYVVARNIKKRAMLINILIAACMSFFILSALYYLSPSLMIGRGLLALTIASFILYQSLWHFLFFFSHNSPRFSQRVMIVGVGLVAHQIGEMIKKGHGGFKLIGYVQCTGESQWAGITDDEIISSADSLRDAAEEHQVELIVIALTERRGVFPLRDALSCKLNGIELLDAPTFYELVSGKLMLEQITPSWFIYSNGFNRPLIITAIKRCIDVLLALLGLILSLPLMSIIAILIKLDSPGPVLFRQVRVGNREKPFVLFKFRTMRLDAEKTSGAVWAQVNDPRATRFGAFMRKVRLDEIPQLFNVLVGQMSFVGPRPERPEFVEKLKEQIPYYSRRHFIKPGLTGWAQVRYAYGASVDDALEKLRYDLYYVKNLSPLIDTLIFLETIKVVLFGRGGR